MQRYWQTLQAQPNFSKVFGSKPLPTEAPKPPAKDAKPKDAKPKDAKPKDAKVAAFTRPHKD